MPSFRRALEHPRQECRWPDGHEIILWLTGHTAKSLQKAIDAEIDIETFYAKAPRFQPNASLIKGVVCGVRVEEIEDETMRKARYLDKLIDELAKGRKITAEKEILIQLKKEGLLSCSSFFL